jgi:hypothetical protein
MNRFEPQRGIALYLLPLAALLLALVTTREASAYTWMIRHDYGGCNQCHADPSGGGLLTPYGRAQGEVLLRMRYGVPVEEPGKVADFAFGVLPLPEHLLLGGDVRGLWLNQKPTGGQTLSRWIWMQADLEAQLSIDRVHVNGSVGYADEGALTQSITHNDRGNLVSRLHWVGVDLDEDKTWMARAGRMNLPFGIRTIEHNLWVRSVTRTTTKDDQQDGVALSYNGEGLRGELMAVLGNYQIHPDRYRDRGYVGYLEWLVKPKTALGAQSMIVHAQKDILFGQGMYRHAHGAYVRWAPIDPVVLLAEASLLYRSIYPGTNDAGYAGMAQVDWEPVQGLHLMLTGEAKNETPKDAPVSTAGWASVAWFFAPHADVRGDLIHQSTGTSVATTSSDLALVQLHLYL